MPFLALNGAVLPASIKMIGEPFYRPLLQGCPDVPKYPELPFPHSPVGGRARPYIPCACSSTLPMETQDRRQSDSAEAYMAFPKMLHSCLACLQWKNPDAGNYSTRQCAAIRNQDTLPEKDWRAVFQAVIGNIPQTPADMLSHLWIPIPRSPVVKSCLQSASRIPVKEPTPPPESGNKEATLIGWGTVVPGMGLPFKATAIPLVRDSHPLFP